MDETIVKIITVLEKYGVEKASLFGSTVRGDFNDKSDIDILIKPAEGTTLFDMAGMQIDLQNNLNKPVDLITYGSINPRLKDFILKDEKIIYEKR